MDRSYVTLSRFCSMGLLFDLVLSWPLLRPGGWLAFDDYGWSDPRPRSQPRTAFDGWLAAVPPDVGRVETVGRLKFVRKAG